MKHFLWSLVETYAALGDPIKVPASGRSQGRCCEKSSGGDSRDSGGLHLGCVYLWLVVVKRKKLGW